MAKVDYLDIIEKYRKANEERHGAAAPKKHHRDVEHKVQAACVRWFSLAHADDAGLLFAIPNGGRRDRVTAAKLKAEGVVAGVADLMLAVPSANADGTVAHGLFVEMKTEEKQSRQRQSQKDWESKVKSQGYEYKVVRSLDEFINVVDAWLRKRS